MISKISRELLLPITNCEKHQTETSTSTLPKFVSLQQCAPQKRSIGSNGFIDVCKCNVDYNKTRVYFNVAAKKMD